MASFTDKGMDDSSQTRRDGAPKVLKVSFWYLQGLKGVSKVMGAICIPLVTLGWR